jgi:riboflavin kinase / FMN adenylyltransferase
MQRAHRGIVEKGAQRGAELGYPTANITLPEGVAPGIYAGKASVEGKAYEAAVFADGRRSVLEAHLLDFSGDLYGKEISVELVKKIREGKAFANDESLRAAIADDVQRVRMYFKAL